MCKNKKNKIAAILGGGPAGVFAAIFAAENPNLEVWIFEKDRLLQTLLPTGGGRCNLAHALFDFKELAKNYPRGEKFLYSVFSRFSTAQTLDFFSKIGVETYTQPDSRIFPLSDSSKEVQKALLKKLETLNVKTVKKEVFSVQKSKNNFEVVTKDGFKKNFDAVIISTGGKYSTQNLLKYFPHTLTEQKPALTSLVLKEQNLQALCGLSVSDVKGRVFDGEKLSKTIEGDLLFTHFGVSGPLIYKISSYFAYADFGSEKPLKILLNFTGPEFFSCEEFEQAFLSAISSNSKKEVSNVLSKFLPKRLSDMILGIAKVDAHKKSSLITKDERKRICSLAAGFEINAVSTKKGEEVVTAGGVNTDEINPKTMESKFVKNLYFCGEVLNIDGLCGGFNLQNCWSTGFIAGSSAAKSIENV